MTNSPNYARETWIPLAPEGRIWETVAPPTLPHKTKTRRQVSKAKKEGDFAREAAYSRPGLLTAKVGDQVEDPETLRNHKSGSREGAPIISEKHMWGVVDEWGEKAGKWGKGVKAHKKEE